MQVCNIWRKFYYSIKWSVGKNRSPYVRYLLVRALYVLTRWDNRCDNVQEFNFFANLWKPLHQSEISLYTCWLQIKLCFVPYPTQSLWRICVASWDCACSGEAIQGKRAMIPSLNSDGWWFCFYFKIPKSVILALIGCLQTININSCCVK